MSAAVVDLRDRVAANVEAVRARIRSAGGDPDAVRLVAVTKGFGPEVVEAALSAGVVDVAESYAQELETKAAVVSGPRWHFVGRLQTNKVRRLAPLVELWQSVDRPALVAELARRAPRARTLVQVNVSAAPGQGGCDPRDVPALVDQLRACDMHVAGLMAVGAGGPPEQARAGFRLLAGLADGLDLEMRSMGMSADLEVAVEEGSTMLRIGRALFGPRAPVPTGTGEAQRLPAN
ncbi:YggS family pyridoxal phosphate-dependent enzyme [soil metagenome]